MTRDEFIARVSDLLRRSDVVDADHLINLLEAHVKGEFPPGCGAFAGSRAHNREYEIERGEPPTAGVCVLGEGHDGYHKDVHGYGWKNF